MAYEDRHGITSIRKERDVLSISRDNMDDGVVPILLYTPVAGEIEHYHIELSKEETKSLYTWLRKYLEDDSLDEG